MAVWKFIIGNLRRRRSYSVVICIMIFLAGLILSVSASTIRNAETAYNAAHDRSNGPHITYWINSSEYKKEQLEWFKSRSEVDSVSIKEEIIYNGASFEDSKGTYFSSGDILLQSIDSSENKKIRIVDGTNKPLGNGGIYLPSIAKTNLGLAAGDKLDFVFGKNRFHFHIAGFFEDTLFGGAMIDIKSVYMSKQDLNKILGMDKTCFKITFLKVRLVNYSQDNITRLNKMFLEKYNNSVSYVNEFYSQKSFHLMLPRIALAVMTVFAVLLFLITLTIIRYAILATIEADFVNIGIVKALGFTPHMVQLAITGQYGLLATVSAIASFVTGFFATPLVGRLVLKSSGLIYDGEMTIRVVLLLLIGLTFLITMFAFFTSQKTRGISPIRAIAQGTAPNYYASILNVSLEKLSFLPFDLKMSLKQILTKAKRYLLLVFICSLLAYALILLLGVSSYLKTDKAISMLGVPLSDIELDVKTKISGQKLINEIKKDYKVNESYFESSRQLLVQNEKSVTKISDSYDRSTIAAPVEGRYPIHDNEIAISVMVKQKYKCKIGDYLLLGSKNGKNCEFLVTGIFQTVREGGSVSYILESGMKRIDPLFELNEIYLKLDGVENLDTVIAQMKKRYTGYEEISNQYEQTIEQINSIRTVFDAVTQLVFGITVIMIGIITLLIMKVTVFSETKELGIFKALGFDSVRLRRQLALRLLLISLIGSSIGIFLEAFTGSMVMSLSLAIVGVAKANLDWSLQNSGIAVITIAILSLSSAYLSSRNVKSVSAYTLINE